MDNFEKAYLKMMSSYKNHVIKEDVDQNTINNVIELLTKCKNNYEIPGAVKKLLADAISLLGSSNSDTNGAFIEEYVWEDKVIKICKDEGQTEYYFVLNDPNIFNGEDYVSYMNAEEFENETGLWEIYEECLNEVKKIGYEIWDKFDFNNFKKIK